MKRENKLDDVSSLLKIPKISMAEFPFFVYDHSAVVQEGDDLMDAIMFYHPKSVPLNSQCALCGQLMGMVHCLQVISGAAPSVYHLRQCKVAVRHTGRFTLALGASADLPDAAVVKQLDSLMRLFCFYHGSLDTVLKQCGGEKQAFLLAMERIWECYLPYIQHYGRTVPTIFDAIPAVPLPKSAGVLFLRASHILQSCQRKPGVLAGCLLYDGKVLCTQLPPELTSRLLLIKANQTNHPANEVETDFSLPFGVRVLSVFLTRREYRCFSSRSQKLFPARQRHTAVSAFQSARGGRLLHRTATGGENLPLRGVGDGCEATGENSREQSFIAPSTGESSREQSFIAPPFRLTDSYMDTEDQKSTVSSIASDDSAKPEAEVEPSLCRQENHRRDAALCAAGEADTETGSRRDSAQSGASAKSNSTVGMLASYEAGISLSSTELADEKEQGGISEESSVLVMKGDEPDLPDSHVENCPGDDSQVTSPDVHLPEVLTTDRTEPFGNTSAMLPNVEPDEVGSSGSREGPAQEQPAGKTSATLSADQPGPNSEENMAAILCANVSGASMSPTVTPGDVSRSEVTPGDASRSQVGSGQECVSSACPTGVCEDVSEGKVLEESCQDVSNQKSQDEVNSSGGTLTVPDSQQRNPTDCTEGPDETHPIEDEAGDVISNRTVAASGLRSANTVAQDENAEDIDVSHSHTNTNTANTPHSPTNTSHSHSSTANTVTQNENAEDKDISQSSTTNTPHSHSNTSHSHSSTANTVRNSSADAADSEYGQSVELCMEGLEDISNCRHADSLPDTGANSLPTIEGDADGIRTQTQLEADGIRTHKLWETGTATSNDRDAAALRETEATPPLPNLTPEKQNGSCEKQNGSSVEQDTLGVSRSNVANNLTDVGVEGSLQGRFVDAEGSLQDRCEDAAVEGRCVDAEGNLPGGCVDAELVEDEESTVGDTPRRKAGCGNGRLPGVMSAGLYVQGHSHMVLLMLTEKHLQNDLPTMQGLWKTCVTALGELEGDLREVVLPAGLRGTEEGYNFLHFDGFDRLLKGNIPDPVLAPDVAFCSTARFVHQQFQQSDSLNDVLIRNQSAGVYGSSSLSQETFFQLRGLGRGGQQGVPSPHDPLFNLENRARKKLFKDHHITFF